MIQSLKRARLLLLFASTVLLLSVLASCGTSKPTGTPESPGTPVPTSSQSARTTDTPAPPSATPEPQTDEEANVPLVLPHLMSSRN